MNIPFFYAADLNNGEHLYSLDEVSVRHCLQVLRKKEGDMIMLTNGRGKLFRCMIEKAEKKNCLVSIQEIEEVPAKPVQSGIGIAFTKNISRIEWFLEKVTEIGITDIYPLITQRTERIKFNFTRLQNIIVAAVLQSEQAWLPQLHEQISFDKLIEERGYDLKFIAHCENEEKHFLADETDTNTNTLILIGPEGDFTPEEISLSKEYQFIPVSLGPNRLRTETAGLAACVMMNGIKRLKA
jgi:16S rRNA (uracil1498-N3)-methyltransferase